MSFEVNLSHTWTEQPGQPVGKTGTCRRMRSWGKTVFVFFCMVVALLFLGQSSRIKSEGSAQNQAQNLFYRDDFNVVPDTIIIQFVPDALRFAPGSLEGISETRIPSLDDLIAFYRVERIWRQFRYSSASENSGQPDLSRLYKVKFPPEFDPREVASTFASDPNVEFAQVIGIHPVHQTSVNDIYFPNQWALDNWGQVYWPEYGLRGEAGADIGAIGAWELAGTGDAQIAVAVLDTGVDWKHPDLAGSPPDYTDKSFYFNQEEVYGQPCVDDDGNGYVDDFSGWDWVDGVLASEGEDAATEDNDPMDFSGHGTHCAGVIAAIPNNAIGVAGLAPGCRILPLRTGWESPDGLGYVGMDSCAEAIVYAADKGAGVILCGWDSSNSGAIAQALDYAINKGVTVVTSAGNENTDVPHYLASREDCIAVAATDACDLKAPFSNYGEWVDISAPGVNVISTFYLRDIPEPDSHTYAYQSGTSTAAAHVAAIIAMLKAYQPDLTPEQIATILCNSADKLDARNPGFDGKLGSGTINAENAMLLLTTTGVATPGAVAGAAQPSAGEHTSGNEVKTAAEYRGLIESSLLDRIQNSVTPDEPTRVIVLLKRPPESKHLGHFASQGGFLRHTFRYAARGFSGSLPIGRIKALANLLGPDLKVIKEDRPIRMHLDKSVQIIRVRPVVWESPYSYTGDASSSIAILDTGIDDSHPDLPGYQDATTGWPASAKVVGWHDTTADNNSSPVDYQGHGSHVASTAAGTGAALGSDAISQLTLTFTGTYPDKAGYGYIDMLEIPSPGNVTLNMSHAGPNQNVWISLRYPTLSVPLSPISGTEYGKLNPIHATYSAASKGTYFSLSGQDSNALTGQPFSTLETFPYEDVGDGQNLFTGVAPTERLVGVKIFSNAGAGYSTNMYAAFEWLIANKATYQIKVASMSAGLSVEDPDLRAAANEVVDAGIVFVISAGNDYPDLTIKDPALASKVITVGATNDTDQVTNYSSNGPSGSLKPDVVAPGGSFSTGSKITAVDTNDSDGETVEFTDRATDDYTNMSGTSMSAPHVAGVAGLVIQAMEELTGIPWGYTLADALKVKMILLMTSGETNHAGEGGNTPTLERGGKDLVEGYGRINADAAVEAVTLAHVPGTTEAPVTLGEYPTDKKVWACWVQLTSGQDYQFDLTVPEGADFDLYLYDNLPDSDGNPVILASSVDPNPGTDERITYNNAPASDTDYLVVKWVSGSGQFELTSSTSPRTFVSAYTEGTPTVPPSYVAGDTTGNCLGTFLFGGSGTISAITLTAYGSCTADTALANVKLFLDDGDGNWQPGEDTTLLGEAPAFVSDKATFSGLSLEASSNSYVHVVLDVTSAATHGETVGIEILQATDVSSTTTVTAASWPVQLGLSSIVCWDTDWSHSQMLVLDNSALATPLDDFPILVKLTWANFDFSLAQEDGADIRFVDSDGLTSLSHEIELWDSAKGVAIIWVKVPQIAAAPETDYIWMYYGNSAASDAQNPPDVWSNGYVAVYHFAEQNGSYQDSTANNNDSNDYLVRSQDNWDPYSLGYYPEFGGYPYGDYVGVPDADSLDFGAGDFTVLVHVNAPPDAVLQDTDLIRKGSTDTASSWFKLEWGDQTTTNSVHWLVQVSGMSRALNHTLLPDGIWHSITGTRNAGTNKISLFIDTASVASGDGVSGSVSNSANMGIGSKDTYNDDHYDGYLDEVRLSNVLRSPAWIAAEHLSMNDQFITSYPPVRPAITVGSSTSQPESVPSPSTHNVMGSVSIVKNTGTGTVNAVTLKENGGTIDASTELENVELWLSSDDTWEIEDTQLNGSQSFSGPDGTVTFTMAFAVTTVPQYLIVVADVKSNVASGKTIEIQLQALDTADKVIGVPCDILGTTTIGPELAPVWGVLHSIHTTISDGTETPAERVVNLQSYYDWAATVDHDTQIDSGEWTSTLAEANDNNQDYSFTYFAGYEWKGTAVNNAEITAFFVDNGPTSKVDGNNTAYDTFSEFIPWLEANNGLGCINHPARSGNPVYWDNHSELGSEYLPCVEMLNKSYYHWNDYWIYAEGVGTTYANPHPDSSNWNGAVKKALDNGLHLGFVAGWDYHGGYPGTPTAYTGLVNPPTWTRQGVFDTIKARHTWAAEERILMSVTYDDGVTTRVMGDIFSVTMPQIVIDYDILAFSGYTVTEVNLFFDGIIVQVHNPGIQSAVGSFTITFSDNVEHYVFLEAIQNNGKRAWSSPMYITCSADIPTISSVANQTFEVNDPPTVISPITVTDAPVTATITSTNDIRIGIPSTFKMSWDTTDTIATIAGFAEGKVSATVSYEDSGKTLVIDVTADFAAGDSITVSDLSFTNFTAVSPSDNLELITGGSEGLPVAYDDKTKSIVASQESFQDGVFPTESYSGTRDTYINGNEGYQNTNFGDGTNTDPLYSLNFDGDNPEASILIKWDISWIPSGSEITAARITFRNVGDGSDQYELYELKKDWVEGDGTSGSGATWNTYNGTNNWEIAGAQETETSDRGSTVLGTIQSTGTGGYLIIELNSDGIAVIQNWIDEPEIHPNFGFIIQDYSAGNGGDVYSREYGIPADRPKLTIDFTRPTAVELISFEATDYDDRVALQWRTGYEVDNLGFHVYREEDGELIRVTPQLVAGSAFLAGPKARLTAGLSYSWWDVLPDDAGPVQYWLEDVDLNGPRTWHGPVAPIPGGKIMPELLNAMLLSELGRTESESEQAQARIEDLRDRLAETSRTTSDQTVELLTLSPMMEEEVFQQAEATLEESQLQWDLAAGSAVKIAVREDGWYRIGQPALLAAGLDRKVDPRYLQLFANGEEQPILVPGEEDGRFNPHDAIEFYGEGLDTPYADTQIYWLVEGSVPGKRIPVVSGEDQGVTGDPSFLFTVEHKERTIFFAALKNGEAGNFFGPLITAEPADQILSVPHIDSLPPGGAVLQVGLQGVTTGSHRIGISLNDEQLAILTFEGQDNVVAELSISQSTLLEGDNLVTLAAEAGGPDVSLVDFIRLTYWHTYAADDDALRFAASGGEQVTIGDFSDPTIRVVDVTDPQDVQEITGVIQSQGTAYAITINVLGSGSRTLLAFTEENIKSSANISSNSPSKWHQGRNGADIVIITHGDFIESMEALKVFREGQGWSVALMDIEDIYDEFNFGVESPWAVRDFLLLTKNQWRYAPRFVLLVGDASFDPRNYFGKGDFDFVPTKIVETTSLETACDDWFADVNDDGLPEMAVGRLPVRTAEDATAVVEKILGYEEEEANGWAEKVLLVADKNDEFDFEAGSDQVEALLPADMTVEEIFRGQNPSTAKSDLLQKLNEGQLLVNYIGHGSVEIWGGKLLTSDDAGILSNNPRLPFLVGMTCLNGYFHDLYTESLAEALLRAKEGGALAVWTSSGLTGPGGQVEMNKELIRLLFSGEPITLGEAVIGAKAVVKDLDIRRTWILFGDPTTKLK